MADKDVQYLQTCFTQNLQPSIFQVLRKQQLQSLRCGHLSLAQQAKNKYSRLKQAQVKLRHSLLLAKNKQNVREVERQAEQDILEFQKEWEVKLRSHIDSAKRQEENLQRQHDEELRGFSQKIMAEQLPRVKYGPTVLILRKNLENQIKVREYREAEVTREKLVRAEEEEAQAWRVKYEEKQKLRYQQLIKRQENQFKALRTKLQTQFNERIKEREVKFHILLKKNQKRKIQQAKLNQTCTLELSRDMSRTLNTVNRPLHKIDSRSSQKKSKTSNGSRPFFN